MAELAAVAGVSRQSVYNEFGSREAVARALVSVEVDAFLQVVDSSLASTGDAVAAIGSAAGAVFDMAAGNPLLRCVLAGDDPSLVPLLSSDMVLTAARAHVRAGVPVADPLAVDAIVRLVISHVLNPGDSRPDIHELARRLLA